MIHHVALGPEALATSLRALVRPFVVVNTHVNQQIMLVVERLVTLRYFADKFRLGLMVCQMRLQILA